jgi:hypothetical protein
MAAMRCRTGWRAKHQVRRSASSRASDATRRGSGYAMAIADEPMIVLVFSRAESSALFGLAQIFSRQLLSKSLQSHELVHPRVIGTTTVECRSRRQICQRFAVGESLCV